MIKLNGFYWINILFNLIKNSIWILNFSWQLTSLVQQVLLLPGHRQVSHNTTLRLIMEGMWKTPGQWNKDTWIVVLKSIKEGSIINQKAICLAKCHGICWENHLRFLFDKNYSRIKQYVGMVSRLPNIKEVLLSFFPSTMTQQQKGSHNGTSFLKYHVFLSLLFILHLTSQHQRRKEKRFCSVTFQLLQNHTSPMNLINHSYIW
jgi:hypothetical protein